MKRWIPIIVIFLLAIIFSSCEKDNSSAQNVPPKINKAPVANAGEDVIITSTICINSITARLDGNKSMDPDGQISSYSWKKISGPGVDFTINDAFTPILTVSNIEIGDHAFELTVRDTGNLESRDTVLVSLKKGVVKAYDIDINFNSPFFFKNNSEVYDLAFGSYYLDETQIKGFQTIDSLGNFDIYVSENADTAELSDVHDTHLSIVGINPNLIGVSGRSSINFKKLIREGGGAFSGTLKIEFGSAAYCEDNIFKDFPPLTVTGSLDVTTRMVSLKIKGKVYF